MSYPYQWNCYGGRNRRGSQFSISAAVNDLLLLLASLQVHQIIMKFSAAISALMLSFLVLANVADANPLPGTLLVRSSILAVPVDE